MDHLDVFFDKLFFYLTGSKNEVNIFRKHNNKLDLNGDISFPVNSSAWKKYSVENNTIINRYFNKEIALMDELILQSKNWPIFIEKCNIEKEKLNIFLHRSMCFQQTVEIILSKRKCYASSEIFQQKNIQIQLENTESDYSKIDLTVLRMRLLKDVINNLLKKCGNNSSAASVAEVIYLTNKSKSEIEDKKIVCGVVIGNKFGKKNTAITAEEYYKYDIITQ